MRLKISHDTIYRYQEPARGLIQALRMTPREYDGLHVQRWRIEPSVDGTFRHYTDHLGNRVHVFSAEQPVKEIVVRVAGEVETGGDDGVVRGTAETAPPIYFLRDTELTLADPDLRAFALRIVSAGGDTLAVLHRLLAEINREVRFDVRRTYVTTTAREAFAMRHGVCQDMTHVFIAAARVAGIPCRYISGYFRRGDGVVEQEAGHAWAEAFVDGFGWVGFDAANGISTTEAHLRIAVGLDYYGAAPVRGSRIGGGAEELEVAIRVEQMKHQSRS